MTWLVTADLHLDDKPMHAYRWGIFDWMAKQECDHTLILGDITDQKDCHSASLVNRMVAGLQKLKPPVYILKGNHDFIDPANPFFGFLRHMEGLEFITEPTTLGGITAIPHQANQRDFDAACKTAFSCAQGEINLVLLHGLFDGAISETGQRLTGLRTPLVEQNHKGLVLAGDIHAPQQVGCVTYVGAPYRVRFGDEYFPRVLLVNGSTLRDLRYPCPLKHSYTIRNPEDILIAPNLAKGDQVKLTIELPREEVVQWAEVKQRCLDICKELGVEVFDIKLKLPEAERVAVDKQVRIQSPQQVFDAYCLAEDIRAEVKQAGKELLKHG